MKKLFKEQNVSIYQINKDLNLHHCRLYRYANKEIDIEKMPVSLIIELAYYFHKEINKFYQDMVDYLK